MNKPINEHFKAAMRMAHHLPHIITNQVKRAQQKAILRELIAGLKYGLPPTKNCGSLPVSAESPGLQAGDGQRGVLRTPLLRLNWRRLLLNVLANDADRSATTA